MYRLVLALLTPLTLMACGNTTSSVSVDASTDAVPLDSPPPPPPPDVSTQPDAPTQPDRAAPADVPPDPPVVVGSCDPVQPGMVTGFMVDGTPRSFILTVPSIASSSDRIADAGAAPPRRRWPVVFNWHGFGDNAANMNQILASEVNNATMPFILVTPSSTGLSPITSPPGLDWDQIMVTIPNREAHLFDAALRCLDERYGVDRERVYTVGFSAGAILSNLLGTMRGDQIAAVAAFSGAYLNNPANTAMLGAVASLVSWPPFIHERRYPEMIVFGGAADRVSLAIVMARFEDFARADIPVLRARGHDVVVCPHGGAHVIPRALTGANLVRFFADHPRTARRSPWAMGLPMGYPSYCTLEAGM